jgi:hypothetical protein
MATPQDYIKRFFAGMQQRNQILIGLLNRKREIDERIRSKGTRTDMDITRLTQLIGTDNKLRQGRLEDQSIRYLLWKAVKSANFLEKWKGTLIKKAGAEGVNPEAAKEMQGYIKWIQEQLSQIKNYTITFEDIYEQEIIALSATQKVEDYLRHVEKEKELLNAYTAFRARITENAKPRINKILYLIKNYKKEKPSYKATVVFLAFMAFTLGLLPYLPGPFAPKAEEIPLFPAFAVIATALWASADILKDIQATLDRFQKEVWTD